jgi:hypothetical protein
VTSILSFSLNPHLTSPISSSFHQTSDMGDRVAFLFCPTMPGKPGKTQSKGSTKESDFGVD